MLRPDQFLARKKSIAQATPPPQLAKHAPAPTPVVAAHGAAEEAGSRSLVAGDDASYEQIAAPAPAPQPAPVSPSKWTKVRDAVVPDKGKLDPLEVFAGK